MRSLHLVAAFGSLWLVARGAPAQQVTVGTPNRTVSDSFFERMGVHWGFNWKGMNVSFGGPNMAVPPFGGFDPSAGMNGGFAVQRPGFNGFFNWAANQGYRQSFTTQVPSVTLMNGQPGFISDTSQSPFVISYIPVVGGFPTVGHLTPVMPVPTYSTPGPGGGFPAPAAGNPRVQAMRRRMAEGRRAGPSDLPEPPAFDAPAAGPRGPMKVPNQPAEGGADRVAGAARPAAADARNPAERLALAQSSSAGRAVPSVAEARRLHQLEQAARGNEAMVLFERGVSAEEGGKPGVAKVYYRMALKRAAGEFRGQVQARLEALRSSDTP